MFVNITIPVYNEQEQLPSSIRALHQFLLENCRFDFEIIIADNASVDRTLECARELEQLFKEVRVVHLELKGRGRALKEVWINSKADVLSYMDVDLSTNLFAFPPLIEAVACGGADIGTGSRLMKGSRTQRGLKREVISRCYNLLVKAFFQTRFSDAQCGFKAISREAAHGLLPLIEDPGWFFDTELLVIAEKLGYRIFDVPVRWIDDLDSRVKIIPTALEDVRGLIRVKRGFLRGQYRADSGKTGGTLQSSDRPTLARKTESRKPAS
jgi:glycosyltransferase involved in cell wall biosynthesis